jgi:hypothetical protein
MPVFSGAGTDKWLPGMMVQADSTAHANKPITKFRIIKEYIRLVETF